MTRPVRAHAYAQPAGSPVGSHSTYRQHRCLLHGNGPAIMDALRVRAHRLAGRLAQHLQTTPLFASRCWPRHHRRATRAVYWLDCRRATLPTDSTTVCFTASVPPSWTRSACELTGSPVGSHSTYKQHRCLLHGAGPAITDALRARFADSTVVEQRCLQTAPLSASRQRSRNYGRAPRASSPARRSARTAPTNSTAACFTVLVPPSQTRYARGLLTRLSSSNVAYRQHHCLLHGNGPTIMDALRAQPTGSPVGSHSTYKQHRCLLHGAGPVITDALRARFADSTVVEQRCLQTAPLSASRCWPRHHRRATRAVC